MEENIEKVIAVWADARVIKPTPTQPLGILGKYPVIRTNKKEYVRGACRTCPQSHKIVYNNCTLDKFIAYERT